jgi:hypothetical protein
MKIKSADFVAQRLTKKVSIAAKLLQWARIKCLVLRTFFSVFYPVLSIGKSFIQENPNFLENTKQKKP